MWRRRADAAAIEREGWIPVGDRGFIGDAFDLRHEIPRHGGTAHRGDAADRERAGCFLHPPVQRLGQEIPQLDGISHRHWHALGSEIVGHPPIDDDLVRPRCRQQAALLVDKITDGQARGVDAHDGRIRNARPAWPAIHHTIHQRCHCVGQKCERGSPSQRPKHLGRCEVGLGREQQPAGTEPPRPTAGRLVADKPKIVERWPECRPQDGCSAGLGVRLGIASQCRMI